MHKNDVLAFVSFLKRRSRQCEAAFTLTEVLVTVLIIAVLAACLLPALQGVRNKAESAKTLSNLHQIGLAVAAYAPDHQMQLPAIYTQTSDGYFPWPYLLVYYGYMNDSILQIVSGKSVTKNSLQLLYNPITRRKHPNFTNAGGYGLNGFTNTSTYNESNPGNVKRQSLLTLLDPATIILVADGQCGSSGLNWALLDYNGYQYIPNTLSGGYAHYLFCDNHVERIPAQNTTASNSLPVGYGQQYFLWKK
jgi:prepilin-type N-terminal cleavage/methylation domain-containing protein/prepilin-type processing-associated H-X9-DG protein